MARTAEVVTVKMLNENLTSAQSHFQKAGQSRRIADSVQENKEAFDMLSESATMHEEAALKDIRRVQVKVVNAFAEASFTVGQLETLLIKCEAWKIFPSGDVVVTQPQPEDKKEEVKVPEVAPEVVNAPVIVGAV